MKAQAARSQPSPPIAPTAPLPHPAAAHAQHADGARHQERVPARHRGGEDGDGRVGVPLRVHRTDGAKGVRHVAQRARSAFPSLQVPSPSRRWSTARCCRRWRGWGWTARCRQRCPTRTRATRSFCARCTTCSWRRVAPHGHPVAAPPVPSPVSWRTPSSRAGGGDRRYARLPGDREALPD